MRMITARIPLFHWFVRHRSGRPMSFWALSALLLLSLGLAACNDTPPPPTDAALTQLHWCGKQTLLFQDSSQTPPTVLTDWAQVKASLDFSVYLPQRLPLGTCLVSGEALIHDKVLGSSFGVSYLLPGGVSLAFSETAVSGSPATIFACSPSTAPTPTTVPTKTPAGVTPTPATPTPTPGAGNAGTLLCLGSKDQTNIVIDSDESDAELQTLFTGLKANVDWIPKG
jgi:hypothetical protein